MKKPRKRFPLIADIERPHPTVADKPGDALGATPLTVRLAESWSDFLRTPAAAGDSEGARDSRTAGAVPLLDDMKGILQWE